MCVSGSFFNYITSLSSSLSLSLPPCLSLSLSLFLSSSLSPSLSPSLPPSLSPSLSPSPSLSLSLPPVMAYRVYKALYPFTARDHTEVSMLADDYLFVYMKEDGTWPNDNNWMKGRGFVNN